MTVQSGGFKQPPSFALPGAKAPLTAERLKAHLESGKTVHQVVQRVNQTWARDPKHAELAKRHKAWVAEYDRNLAEFKHKQDLARVLEATRAARIEAELAELAEREGM